MEARKFSISNKTRTKTLGDGVRVIDAAREPLMILKVLVEGLAADGVAGLWLRNLLNVPMVPRIAPFDLVYLDGEHRVTQGAELVPAANLPPFRRPAVGALILPFGTLAATGTVAGDELSFTEVAEEMRPAEESPARAGAEPPGTSLEAVSARGPEPKPALPGIRNGWSRPEAAIPERIEVRRFRPEPVGAWEQPGIAGRRPGAAAVRAGKEAPRVVPEPLARPRIEPPGSHGTEPGSEFSSESAARPDLAAAGTPPRPPPVVAPDRAENREHWEHSDRLEVSDDQGQPEPSSEEADDGETGGREGPVGRLLRWLYPGAMEGDRRHGRRRPIPEMVAYESSTGSPRAHEVGDISATGIYLLTPERWELGAGLSLLLQRKGPFGDDGRLQLALDATAVRHGADGVGLTFRLPAGMDTPLWQGPPREVRFGATDPEYVLREFRTARALALLSRICPSGAPLWRRMLYEDLGNLRVDSAVNVLLRAEGRLPGDGVPRPAPAPLVARLLQGAAWSDPAWMQQLWANLLVSTCAGEDSEEASLVIDLLGRLALIQARILLAVCEKAAAAPEGGEDRMIQPVYCNADELVRISGSSDLLKINRAMAQLSEFGLIERSLRSTFVPLTEAERITPTGLGLAMYARVSGRRHAAGGSPRAALSPPGGEAGRAPVPVPAPLFASK